jgi:hypothetical protein
MQYLKAYGIFVKKMLDIKRFLLACIFRLLQKPYMIVVKVKKHENTEFGQKVTLFNLQSESRFKDWNAMWYRSA